MYFVPIHVPIYVRGSELLLATDWKRSLLLLRDSFGGRYGRVHVLSPYLDALTCPADQVLEPITRADDIDLFPSFPFNTRARAFWTAHVHTWRRDVAAQLPYADVVHGGGGDVFRPMTFIATLMGHRAGKPTLFVMDTDPIEQQRDLARGKPARAQLKAAAYSEACERTIRYGVARASLSLLKGKALMQRYGHHAYSAFEFHDTSFLGSEVIPRVALEQRLRRLESASQPLRLVYCGRFERRKGLPESLEAVARARARGTEVAFDVIGGGGERAELEREVQRLGLGDCVRFLGTRPYGKELLRELSAYDALFFTPTAEDTPRMIFDGYAAGLPLLGYAIPYVLEREREDAAAISCAREPDAAADLIGALDRDRARLARLSRVAREAALHHSADAWYRRRAEATDAAIARHNSPRSLPPPAHAADPALELARTLEQRAAEAAQHELAQHEPETEPG
jgi:glycosyltransferase involved in cell wall biosynthesis